MRAPPLSAIENELQKRRGAEVPSLDAIDAELLRREIDRFVADRDDMPGHGELFRARAGELRARAAHLGVTFDVLENRS